MIDTIFVDMDGVLANFDKRFKDKFGKAPTETRSNKDFGFYFTRFIEDGEFSNLEPMTDARLLLDWLDKTKINKEILSSTARPERHGLIAPQKQLWLIKHKIYYKANFVPGKSLKYKFATKNSIIIDDTNSVIDDWNKAGGIGILHKDTISTIKKLEMYI